MIKTQCEQCKKYNASCTENIVFNGQSCEQYSKRIDLEKKNDNVSESEKTTIETTNVVNNNGSNLLDNERIINCIYEIGEHARFLSIVGYVFLALMGIGVIGFLVDGEIGAAIIYLLLVVGCYFINNNLWKVSKIYRDIPINRNVNNLEFGVKRMSVFWKTMAIICKVYLIILVIIFVVSFATGWAI